MINNVTYFAQSNWRRENKPVGIYDHDRMMHIHVMGKTGTGKSTMIKTMILQDIQHGKGCALFDPNNDLVIDILSQVPEHRRKDVVYLDMTDSKLEYGYNPLRKVPYEMRALVASGVLEVFKKLWKDAWGVRLEHILRNVLLSLLDMPKADLRDVPKLLLDKVYRRQVIRHVKNPEVQEFWEREFPKYTYGADALTPVLNKIGAMLSYPVIRRFLVENENRISLRKIMDEKKILLVNVSVGHIGSDQSNIIGSLLVHALGLAGMSRAMIPEGERIPFFVYVDEFQNFATLSFVQFLSQIRKYKISYLLCHQFLGQVDNDIARAVIGNVGSSAYFRTGSDDAHYISRGFMGRFLQFQPEDFMYLPNFHVYISLLINGEISRGFTATSLQSIHA